MDMMTNLFNWAKDRLTERTTLDGTVLIAAGVIYLVFQPLAVYAAYGAIAYGAWTIYKKQK